MKVGEELGRELVERIGDKDRFELRILFGIDEKRGAEIIDKVSKAIGAEGQFRTALWESLALANDENETLFALFMFSRTMKWKEVHDNMINALLKAMSGTL